MTRWLPIGLLMIGLTLLGCNRDSAPKGDGGKKETPVAQNGDKPKGDSDKQQAKTDKSDAKDPGGMGSDPKPKDDPIKGKGSDDKGEEKKQKSNPVLKPEMTVTAKEMAQEFVSDQKAAHKKYNGKIVEVTGEVAYVSYNGAVDRYSVTIDSGVAIPKKSFAFSVHVDVPPGHRSKAFRFAKGQKIKAVGKYHSDEDVYVRLGNGTFTELEPSKILVVTAEQLAKDFEMDAEAAAGKYLKVDKADFGKTEDYIVKGVIDSIETKDGEPIVRMRGTLKTKVVFEFGRIGLDDQTLKALAKGRTLEVRCKTGLFGFAFQEGELKINRLGIQLAADVSEK